MGKKQKKKKSSRRERTLRRAVGARSGLCLWLAPPSLPPASGHHPFSQVLSGLTSLLSPSPPLGCLHGDCLGDFEIESGDQPIYKGREDKYLRLSRPHNPGEGNSNPLQYPCLENPMDRGAWQATVHGVAKSQTRLEWLSSRPHFYSSLPL